MIGLVHERGDPVRHPGCETRGQAEAVLAPPTGTHAHQPAQDRPAVERGEDIMPGLHRIDEGAPPAPGPTGGGAAESEGVADDHDIGIARLQAAQQKGRRCEKLGAAGGRAGERQAVAVQQGGKAMQVDIRGQNLMIRRRVPAQHHEIESDRRLRNGGQGFRHPQPDPQMAADRRAVVQPHHHGDPRLPTRLPNHG